MRIRVRRWGGSWGFTATWKDARGLRRSAESNGFRDEKHARQRGEMFRIYGAEDDPAKRRELKRQACTSVHCGCADDAGR